jgi:type III pantothenate kinase
MSKNIVSVSCSIVPHEPFLVMDISNSYTKYAVVRKKKLGVLHRLPTKNMTVGQFRELRKHHAGMRLVLGSVVPQRTQNAQTVYGRDLRNVHGRAKIGLPIHYMRREQIGADRLANAAAGRVLFGWPVVIVDFGTAVTFDVVDQKGAYCGGVIAPGLNAMTDYLHERTALLPKVTVTESPGRAIGRSTDEAMRIGAVTGYRGLVREVLREIKKELGVLGRLHVVATGGQAEIIAQGLPEIDAVNPLLTLEGLRIIGLSGLLTK